jgi:phage antirepressor YoqD-like protein
LEDSYFKAAPPTAVSLPKTYIEALKHLLAAKESEEAALALVEKQAEKILLDAPKVEFAETVSTMTGTCLIRDFAKVVGTGQNKLFQWLRDQKVLMSTNRPYQKFIDAGYLIVVEGTPYKGGDGELHPNFTTRITGKGQVWLEKKMKAHGYFAGT